MTAIALEKILKTAGGAEMLAQLDRERREKRTSLARVLDMHNARADEDRKPLAARKDAAETALADAQKAVKAAQLELRAAAFALSRFDVQDARLRNEAQLSLSKAGADELVGFLERCEIERQRLRNPRLIEERREVAKWYPSFLRNAITKVVVKDNHAKLSARICRLAEIEREAFELARTKADFADDLDRLWESLPDYQLRTGDQSDDRNSLPCFGDF